MLRAIGSCAALLADSRKLPPPQWLLGQVYSSDGSGYRNYLFLRPLTPITIVLHAVGLKAGGEAL